LRVFETTNWTLGRPLVTVSEPYDDVFSRLYNKKCDDIGSKAIGIKDNATFLT
jgi:hypothetical protein